MGPVAPWPAPFSDAYVAQARALLETRGVLVILAPVGASRRRLAADIAEAPDGPVWFRHVARFGEKGQRYFALQQFFPDVEIAPGDGVDQVSTAVRTVLDDIEPSRPRLVLVNSDLCDPESVEVLVALASAGRIRLIATLTPDAVADQDLLLADAAVIDVPPLAAERVAELLQARYGAPPHPLMVDLLMQRTGGSYSAVRDLADASFAAGLILVVDGQLVTDPGTPAAECFDTWHEPPLIERLSSGEVTDLIELAALLGQLDLTDARACVSSTAIELAIAHGTFSSDGARLTFAWAAEEILVLRSLPVARHRELFEIFAARVPRTLALPGVAVRAADWWLSAGRRLPVDLAHRAAREANLMGRHRRAVIYTDPTANDENRGVALIERAFAFSELGDDTALDGLLGTVDAAALDEEELLVYLLWVSHAESVDDRDALAERAVHADDPAIRRRRAAVRTLAELTGQTFQSAGDDAVTRLRSLAFSSQLSPCNRATAFAVLSAVLRHSGRPAQATSAAEFALRILADEQDAVSAFHLERARELHVMALVSSLDLEGAERAAREHSGGVLAQPGNGRMTSALQVWIAVLQGDLLGALASARLCLAGLRPRDPHHVRGWVEAMTAHVLIRCGRADEAHDYLLAAERHPSRRRQLDLERRMLLASAHDSLAEPELALGVLADVADEAQSHGLTLALIDAMVMSVRIGGPPHLPMLLGVVDDLVDPTGTPLIWQTFARAVRQYDFAQLIELAEHLATRGCRAFAAEIAQYVLDMARRATDLDEATRERLRELATP
jgi:hypothetical protein